MPQICIVCGLMLQKSGNFIPQNFKFIKHIHPQVALKTMKNSKPVRKFCKDCCKNLNNDILQVGPICCNNMAQFAAKITRHPFKHITWICLTCSTVVLLQLRNCLLSLVEYQIFQVPPKEKSRRASSLANKEAMPCHFLYACCNPRELLAQKNVRSRIQIPQTFEVKEHYLV